MALGGYISLVTSWDMGLGRRRPSTRRSQTMEQLWMRSLPIGQPRIFKIECW